MISKFKLQITLIPLIRFAATYYALQAASVVDVFGKIKVAPGFALLFVSVGIANVATVPIAGNLYCSII